METRNQQPHWSVILLAFSLPAIRLLSDLAVHKLEMKVQKVGLSTVPVATTLHPLQASEFPDESRVESQ